MQRQRLALLALIGSCPGGMPRDRVLAYLWPESPEEKARASLNESVYVLRRAFGDGAILTSATELRLDPSRIRVDVVDFETAVKAGEWERAEQLFGGPFLDGFFLGGAGEFDRWAESERGRLAPIQRTVLERLAGSAQERGEIEAAIGWWRKVAAQDPYDARIAQCLMEAMASAGNRAGALEHARVHAALIQAEFETGPDPDVEALAQRIRADGVTGAPAGLEHASAGGDAPQGASPTHVHGSGDADPEAPAGAGQGVPPRRGRPRLRARAGLTATLLLVLTFIVGYSAWTRARAASESGQAPVTLAVLPFHALLAEGEQDVLALGIPDAIITRLATVERVRVRPTSAILGFAQRAPDVPAAGRELQVEYVLTGTIQSTDERLRVNVQLVRVSDGMPLWGEHYDVPRTDILAVQDQVAGHVAAALRLRMSAAERQRFARAYTEDAAAYELYMRGRAQLLRRTEEATRAAVGAFEEAIERDPSYALAHAGLALATAEMHLRYPSKGTAEDWGAQAMRSAHRALDLDAELGEAHEALAAVFRKAEFDWGRTIEESRRAIALNPSLESPHHYMAGAFYHLGLLEEADRALAGAEAINPTGDKVELLRTRGMAALWGGRFAEAVHLLEEAHRRSDRPIADWSLALAVFYAGDPERAEALLLELSSSASASTAARARATLASFRAARGEVAGAEELLRAPAERYMDHHVAYSVGVAHAQLGRPEESIHWLREAVETGFPCYPWFARDPLLAPIRHDPGFQALLEHMRAAWLQERDRYGE